jgi:hypothetical protein
MDCPFVPFHIRVKITRHVGIIKCGKNINESVTRLRTRNSYSPEQTKKHGVGRLIGAI